MQERCKNCHFSGRLRKPEPLREPVKKSTLFGLISWTDGPDDIDIAIYNFQNQLYEEDIFCHRMPEAIRKSKDSWCGEWQERKLRNE